MEKLEVKNVGTGWRHWRVRARLVVAALALLSPMFALPASAGGCNSRAGAQSFMNSTRNLNSTPGNAWYFSVDKGTGVWMDGWNGGPSSMGQNKWFRVTVKAGARQGLVGWVPAPSVSNQWNCSPYLAY